MTVPIVIAASGPTSASLATYRHLDNTIRDHFPEKEIIWSYIPRVAKKTLQPPGSNEHLHPEKVLHRLMARGVRRTVVQSLHLLPGSEFHDLQRILGRSGLACTTGLPLFTSPDDYGQLAEILRPTIAARPGKAIVILGHGTTHPIWTAYVCLEKILRRTFGDRIFVGVLEKFPESSGLPVEIKAAGFTEVCIIPFLLIAGMHFHRDIAGDGPNSWISRLSDEALTVEVINHGLGLFPGLEKLIIRHITSALESQNELQQALRNTAPGL